MKLVSWNVNGLRAAVRKGFLDYFNEVDADIFCVQEIKLQEGQIEMPLDGYYQYWNYALKKGYSGTAVFTKEEPLSVKYGVGDLVEEDEGRILTLEFPEFYLVNIYTPNSQRDLARLPLRLIWEDEMRVYLKALDQVKPVILCGDLNVAHAEIDIRNVKSNIGNSGFTVEERGKMTQLLAEGFVDTYRYFNPNQEGAYSWWSYMSTVRERNIGWRIDYFIASNSLTPLLRDAEIHSHVLGSDHCPIVLEIDFQGVTIEEGEGGSMITDIKMMGKGLLALSERQLNHSVEDVWAMLTENEQLEKWFQELRVGDLREGGFMKFDMGEVLQEELKITELKPYSVLEFDWFGDVARFELHPKQNGCQLIFKEKINTITEQTKKDLAGWHVCLDVIKALLDGEPIQREDEWEKWHEKYVQLVDELI